MLDKIIIIGSLPFPTGGVTSFLERFYDQFSNRIELFLDYVPNQQKNIRSGNILGTSLFRIFLMSCLPIYRTSTVFLNFSTTKSLYLIAFAPKFNRKFCLLLHNGDLSLSSNYFLSKIQCYALNRMNMVFSLSRTQSKFYEINADKVTLQHISSYLYPSTKDTLIAPSPHKLELSFFDRSKDDRKIIIMNGYLKSYYNFKYAYSFAKKYNYKLCIFAYGPMFEEKLYEFLKIKSGKDLLFHHGDLSQSEFNLFLSLSDVYFRPNEVDSFGIACADAIFFGKKAIASDVCGRAPGVKTFPLRDLSDELVHEMFECNSCDDDKFHKFVENNIFQLKKGLFQNETSITRHG